MGTKVLHVVVNTPIQRPEVPVESRPGRVEAGEPISGDSALHSSGGVTGALEALRKLLLASENPQERALGNTFAHALLLQASSPASVSIQAETGHSPQDEQQGSPDPALDFSFVLTLARHPAPDSSVTGGGDPFSRDSSGQEAGQMPRAQSHPGRDCHATICLHFQAAAKPQRATCHKWHRHSHSLPFFL